MNDNCKTYVVYRHVFPNWKSYIGITCAQPVHRRWCNGAGYNSQPKMRRAIAKYGWENITHEILFQGLSLAEANRMEQEAITKYDSVSNGYNISTGGGGTNGIPCSEATKAKIGQKNKGKPCRDPLFFKRWTQEHGAWNKGGRLTPTQYTKIAAERRARCNKKIGAFDPITHVLRMTFDSCTLAAKHVGVTKTVVSRCAHGKRKTAGGFEWRYLDESG